MNVLFINSDCIRTNVSANLCHLSYIRGLAELGCNVTLLSSDNDLYKKDETMTIPKEVKSYSYDGMTFYEKLSLKKHSNSCDFSPDSNFNRIDNINSDSEVSFVNKCVNILKNIIRKYYGPHSIYMKFVKKAKKFKSNVDFDYVISVSTPASSHVLAYKLIKSGNIKAQKWIQIWEDPWYDNIDVNDNIKIFKEEKKILSMAQYICYVSPITLEHQKRLFPESAYKMFWQPLPYYYKNNEGKELKKNVYGYYGDYSPQTRNLTPFYQAAINMKIDVNICGNPENLFKSTDKIHIYPRLSLKNLKPVEDNTSVLVFLCNLKGGQIPGKIYQYSATNKTILFILDGTEEEKKLLKEYFKQFNRYIFCENTVEDISRAINKIQNGDLEDIKNQPLEYFNSTNIVNKILKCK